MYFFIHNVFSKPSSPSSDPTVPVGAQINATNSFHSDTVKILLPSNCMSLFRLNKIVIKCLFAMIFIVDISDSKRL